MPLRPLVWLAILFAVLAASGANATPSIFAYDSGQHRHGRDKTVDRSPETLHQVRIYAYDESSNLSQAGTRAFTSVLAAKGIPDFTGSVRQSSSQIGHGHAFGKHVVKKGEFPEVSSPDDLARIVERVRTHGTHRRQLTNGREAFYDARDNTIVIRNPNSKDGGTVFRPDDGSTTSTA